MPVKMPVLGPKAIPLDVEPVSAAPDGVLDSGIGGNSPVSPSLLTGSDPDYAAIAGRALHSGKADGLLGGGNPQPATPGNSVTVPQVAHDPVLPDTAASEWLPWSLWAVPVTGAASAGLASSSSVSSLAATAPIILTVGPSGQYRTISAAVTFADGDTDLSHSYDIRVAPGTYTNDFSRVTRPMTIEVDPSNSGTVLLLATVPPPNLKGIILSTSSLTVRGLTFQGAAISDNLGGNGAGIRDQVPEGTVASLIVDSCTFTGN